MSLFVTDGEQRATLAVVRALGRAGIPVTVGATEPTCLAGKSRFCAGTVCYPSPLEKPEAFQLFLREEVARGRYRMILPITDITLRLMAENKNELGPSIRVPIPGADRIDLVQDKRCMLQTARGLGIDCPASFMLEEGEKLEDVARNSLYPLVIKPRFSRYHTEGGWSFGSVQFASSPEEFVAKYWEAHAQIPFPLVQEKVQGEGRGVFILLWDGEVKAAFSHRRLREKPPWGGVSVYSESIALDQDLLRKSVALLKAINWQGVAMVEYKTDPKDGKSRFMEVNGRFWGSLQLAIDAGVNFPLILYRLATGEQVAPQLDYRVGVRSRWFLGDLDHLLIRIRHRLSPDGTVYSSRGRLGSCLDFLNFWDRNTHNEVFRFEDPAPGWFEAKSFLHNCLGKFGPYQKEHHAV